MLKSQLVIINQQLEGGSENKTPGANAGGTPMTGLQKALKKMKERVKTRTLSGMMCDV